MNNVQMQKLQLTFFVSIDNSVYLWYNNYNMRNIKVTDYTILFYHYNKFTLNNYKNPLLDWLKEGVLHICYFVVLELAI